MLKQYIPAGETIAAFHASDAFVRSIRGPIGSGKTTACVAEILKRAHEQAPGPDGRRKTRWAAIRNTYSELKTTTLKTWQMWLPENIGKFTLEAPMMHRLLTSTLDFEILFLSADRDEDVKKLLSLELTGGWINEVREVPKAILDALTGRVGRFPPKNEIGPTWSGVLADGMPPDNDHWLFKLAEEDRPEGYDFFAQPGGMTPEAENKHNLPDGYYERLIPGKSQDWIKVYIGGEYGFVVEGKPVYPEYRDTVHVAPEPLAPINELPLFIGIDFGLTPAAVFGQRTARGQWRIIDEFVTEDMGTVRFSEALNARLSEWYPDIKEIECYGDPAGNSRAETDERTALGILNEYTGLGARAAPTNDPVMRREAVAGTLNRLVDGDPGLLISPSCMQLRKGFAGGYHYKRVAVSGDSRYQDKPNKNQYSHPHDALQYLLLGGGEDRIVMRTKHGGNPQPEIEHNVFTW